MTYQGSLTVATNSLQIMQRCTKKINTQVQANHLKVNVNNSESWADIRRMFFNYKKCKKGQ